MHRLPILDMQPDQLPTPKQAPLKPANNLRIVPQLLQPLHHILTDPFLQINRILEDAPQLRLAGPYAYPRRVQRVLRAHAERRHVQQHLHVALRLHEAAHDAVDGVQGIVGGVGQQGRDDGVVGPLAGGVDVGVVGRVEDEVGAAVLQREAAALGDDAGAEAGVVAVDEGAAVALAVRDGEVDGVAPGVGGRGRRRTVAEVLVGGGGGEEFGSLGEVGRRDEVLGGHARDVRVGDPPVPVREGDAQGLDEGVQVRSRVVLVGLEGRDRARFFQLLQDPQRHQRHQPLPVRRVLPDVDALRVAVAGRVLALEAERDGVRVLRAELAVRLEVAEGEEAALVFADFHDGLGDLALVEACLAFRG